MAFPATRMRRLRKSGVLRDMGRETELTPRDFVYPMFVELGTDQRTPIAAMPGVDRLSISHAVEEAGEALDRTLNDGGSSVAGPLLHLVALALGWGAVGRLALRRFG